jgi:TetR/AcrR family transcriptional repressor of nem operon
MSRPSLREKILDAGVAVLHERGYFACGVREITEAAGVPLGSFTNHFRSKEMFAALVLDRYMDGLLEIVARTLRDRSREPLARIASYFDAVEGIAGPLEWRFGCMVANLGLELSMHSEMARARLMTALEQLTDSFAEAIREAQERGQARADIGAEDLAVIVLSGWHGALLRAKVEQRGDAPLMFARTLPLLLRAVTDEPEKLEPHGDDRRGAANPLGDIDS